MNLVERKKARGLENMNKRKTNACVIPWTFAFSLFHTQSFNTHIYIYKNIVLFHFRIYMLKITLDVFRAAL